MGYKKTGYLEQLSQIFAGNNLEDHLNQIVKCDTVGTRFVLMPQNIVNDIGYLDEVKFPHGFSDFEYFLRAKEKGYDIIVNSECLVLVEQNKNYFKHLIINEPLLEYLKTYFSFKYGNYWKLLLYKAYSHRSLGIGTILLAKTIGSHLKWLIYKLILPKPILCRIVRRNWVV